MEESKPRVPFLARFLEFGRTLDQEVFQLKENFSSLPKQRPHNYDRGIMQLRDETVAVKKELAQLRTKVEEISTFSSFIETTKEMVNQQADDLKKMETYLQKYGYKLMEVQEPVTKHPEEQKPTDTGDASVKAAESKPSTPLLEKGSPVLSDITRNILLGKGLSVIKSQENPEATQFEIRGGRHHLVENLGKMQELAVASPSTAEESLLTEQSSVCETSLCITPEVICQRRPQHRPYLRARVTTAMKPNFLFRSGDTQVQDSRNMDTAPVTEVTANTLKIEGNSNKSNIPLHFNQISTSKTNPFGSWGNRDDSRCFSSQTPEEPVLTTERDRERLCIRCENKNTPEEPVLEFQKDVVRQQNTNETRKTPEEPALVSVVAQRNVLGSHIIHVPKKIPEEPVLAYHRSVTQYHVDHESNRTPEEPVLYQSNSQILENITPEEPVMSTAYKKPFSPVDHTKVAPNQIPLNKFEKLRSPAGESSGSEVKRYGVDLPQSPQLSDITLSILSLTNYDKSSSSFPCQELNDVKTRKIQQEVSQDSRTYTEQDENLPVAHENEVSSVWTECDAEKPLLYSERYTGDKNGAAVKCKWAGSHISAVSELPLSPELSDITMNILQGSHMTWGLRNGPGRHPSN